VSVNAYQNSGWKFKGTSIYRSSHYSQFDGVHSWNIGNTGTAGNAITFTQAMTLDASGNLIVGATSNSGNGERAYFDRRNATQNQPVLAWSDGQDNTGFLSIRSATEAGENGAAISADTALFFGRMISGTFTERARINSSGNLLVGGTAAVLDAASKLVILNSSGTVAEFTNTSGTATEAVTRLWSTAASGDNVFCVFYTDVAGNNRGSITYNRAGGLVAYNVTSDYRAKDISGPVTNSGALIDSIPVYMGKMKGATQERPMFIAHETPAYAHTGEKDAVDENGNPVYQQMDASALIPVMWAEIQSLRQRVAQLESN
jgi:hypothetical protein